MIPNRNTGESTTDESAARHYVLGGGELGAAVTELLRSKGAAVRHVDDSAVATGAVDANPTDPSVLETVGLGEAHTVIVADRSDRRNLLVAQLVRTRFDVDRIVVLTNEPERYDPIDEAGHEAVCATTLLSTALVESV